MKKVSVLLCIGLLVFCLASSGNATMTSWEFTIDGKDLMKYGIMPGNDGETPVDAGLWQYARKYEGWYKDENGDWQNSILRSYWDSSNDLFEYWAETTDAKLTEFNLWGYGGTVSDWGEYYKVEGWNPVSNDSKWQSEILNWNPAWGDTPDNNNGELLEWYLKNSYGYSNGMGFNDSEYPLFTFILELDDEDFFNNGGWYNNQEGKLVFWFGGIMDDEYGYTGNYEGNIILQGTRTPVPEPATLFLMGIGLIGLTRLRKKFK